MTIRLDDPDSVERSLRLSRGVSRRTWTVDAAVFDADDTWTERGYAVRRDHDALRLRRALTAVVAAVPDGAGPGWHSDPQLPVPPAETRRGLAAGRLHRTSSMTPARNGFTLVLGGGGVPGLAYLAGALRALRDRGVDPSSAGLVIGTSAGALTGALLRTGCPVDELAERSIGSAMADTGVPVVATAWGSRTELVRRAIGAGWVLARATTRYPFPAPPALLGRAFPGGLVSATGAGSGLGEGWPESPFWAVAVDLVTGHRITLGQRPAHHALPLDRAVRASGAVPGVFAPVRSGRRLLVDGGVHSVTNLDLARGGDQQTVICIAPLAYDPAAPPTPGRRLLRARNNAALRYERLRLGGKRVIVLTPGREQVAGFRVNFLDSRGVAGVHEGAYSHTLTQLDRPAAGAIVDQLVA